MSLIQDEIEVLKTLSVPGSWNKIEAIKRYVRRTGLPLRDAKNDVDAYVAENLPAVPPADLVASAMQAMEKKQQTRLSVSIRHWVRDVLAHIRLLSDDDLCRLAKASEKELERREKGKTQ